MAFFASFSTLISIMLLAAFGSIPTSVQAQENASFDVYVRKNDSLQKIFRRHNLSLRDFYHIINTDKDDVFTRLTPGQRLHFVTEKSRKVKKMVIFKDNYKAVEALNDGHGQFSIFRKSLDQKKIYQTKRFSISHSLYKDGRKAGLSMEVIRELTAILNSDSAVNVKKLAGGTDILVVLEKDIWAKPSKKHVVAVEVASKKKTWTAAKFEGQDTQAEFYHQDGTSVATSFLRYPLENFYVSSHFSLNRKHPIYHTRRPHYGVDLAAPRGTKVWSTAKGKIIFMGTKGGYGKVVIVQHGQHYRTVYAHLSGFHKGLKVGSEVEQKQVIGYVGSTGAATGAHLHYEIRKDGQPHNPLKTVLPTIEKLKGKAWLTFKKQYDVFYNMLHKKKPTA